MESRHDVLPHNRDLIRVRRRLRGVLDASRRRHVADLRFYQLLSEGDKERAARKAPGLRR